MNIQEQSSNQEKKIFESNIRREILNFVTGEKCEMQGGRDMEFTDGDIKKLPKYVHKAVYMNYFSVECLMVNLIQKRRLKDL